MTVEAGQGLRGRNGVVNPSGNPAAATLAAFIKRSEEAFAAGKLLYTPPTLTEPQTMEPAAGTTFFNSSAETPGKDVILKLPAATRKRGTGVQEAGNIRAIGGEINLTGGTLTEASLRTGNNSKSTYTEGLLLNGGEASKDLFDISGTSGAGPFLFFPALYMQRCRGEKIHGTQAGEHADLLQFQGSVGNVYIWLYTGYSQYQGLFLNPAKPVGEIYIDYVNLGYEAGGDEFTIAMWFQEKIGEAAKVAAQNIYLGKNVYIEPKLGQALAQHCVWPPAGTLDTAGAAVGAIEFEIEGKKAVKFPPASRIYGYIKEGPPAGGDFVPKANCGLGYVSPGYLP